MEIIEWYGVQLKNELEVISGQVWNLICKNNES